MTPKPQAKSNLIHQLILSGLVVSQPGRRKHKVWDKSLKDGKGDVVETTIDLPSSVVMPLAQNVSEHNVNRLAKRWAA